jgi:putative ABC transport system permease protein
VTPMFAAFRLRVRALLNRSESDAELDEEVRYHLVRETERNVAKGMSPDAARLAARRAFGNPTVTSENARETMRFRLVEELGQDAAYALRAFRRAPTFVATVVVTIGLGLGLMTAAFTMFDAYVLRPVPVRDPATLYAIAVEGKQRTDYLMTWPETEAIRARRDLIEDEFAYATFVTRFRGQPTFGQLVTGNYFQMLGVPPAIGRTLVPSDTRAPGSEAVVVLSHDMWTSRFGGDSSVVGSSITLSGVRLRVVGIMAPGFGGIESVPFDFWAPITMAGTLDPGRHYFAGVSNGQIDWALRSIVRLRENVSVDEATLALAPTVRRFAATRGPDWENATPKLDSHNGSIPINPETLAAIIPLAIAFGLVLLIACANVANIMLARGMARQREVGVRLALGASRGRLIRQLLTESLLLSVPAAAASFVVSRTTIWLATSAMYASAPTGFAGYLRPLSLSPDFRLFAFILSAAVAAALAFGLAPAMQSTRPGIVQATRGDFDSNLRPSRLRTGLIAAQIGVSALMLVTAGVLLHAARSTDAISPGMRSSDVVQILPAEKSRLRALEMLRRMPGVGDIASSERFPLDGILRDVTLETSTDSLRRAKFNVVSPDYFDILGITVIRGRAFTTDDAVGRQHVILVSRAAAKQFWPNLDPIGRRLRWTRSGGGGGSADSAIAGVVLHDAIVVGVTSDVSPGWIGLSQEWPMVYLPQPVDAGRSVILARVSGAADAAIPAIDRALTGDDSTTIQDIHSLTGSLELQRYPFHAAYWVASALGLIALLLTITGVYGVVAYVVAQRTREFGVRLALGATPRDIVGLVLRQLMRLALAAVAAGALIALGMSRYLASQFTFVDAYTRSGYAIGICTVLVACAVAAYIPSRRASTVNPVEALRADG